MTQIPGYLITIDIQRPYRIWIIRADDKSAEQCMNVIRDDFIAMKIETVEQMDEFWRREF